MRKVLSLIMVLLFAGVVAVASDRDEVTFGGSFTDIEDVGEAIDIGGELIASLTEHMRIGPAVQFTHINPDAGGSVSGTAIGGVFELDLFGGNSGPFVGARALYWVGDVSDTFEYQASARAGFKFGTEDVFAKIFYAKTRRFAEVGNDVNSNDVNIGIGMRF